MSALAELIGQLAVLGLWLALGTLPVLGLELLRSHLERKRSRMPWDKGSRVTVYWH